MALSPEQRAAAQKILDKETGADKRKEQLAAKKERSEIRKDKELELKKANLKIRQDREKRRGDVDKQRQSAKKKSEASKKAATHAAKAQTALKTKTQTITDTEGDATSAGKAAENIARSTAGIAKSIYHRVKQRQAMKGTQDQPKKKSKPLPDPWKEEFLHEVDDVDSKKTKLDKTIDVMRGKNKIEVNPKIQAEAKVDQGLDDEAKEDTRNYRKFGTKHNQAGTARFRRALHRSRRGEKKIKGVKESVTIEDAKGRPFLEIIDIIKPEPMKSPKNNIKFEEGYGKDKKVDKVKCAVENERKRKNALQIQKTIGTQ
jgi:hypothetical protein